MRKILAAIGGTIAFVTVAIVFALTFWPAFGGKVTGARLERARLSPQYKSTEFANAVPQGSRTYAQIYDYARRQFMGNERRHPDRAIPVVPLVIDRSVAPAPGLRLVWLGHASVYLEIDGLRVLLDPIFSDFASPFAGIGPKRFHPTPLSLAALPKIDAVLISHDHYDHLDMATIKQLAANGSKFYVPLGVGAHLARWGVRSDQIGELDWWQTATVSGVTVTATPVRHYSGRSLQDRNQTLWSSWVIAGSQHRAFYSGDTGAGDHFQSIGDKLGPFDFAVMKIGAYGPGQNWQDIHMEPEAAVAAHRALRAMRLLPVHWGTFNLAFHDWDEPIKRAVAAASAAGIDMVTPRVGEVVTSGRPFQSQSWWQ